MSRDHSARLETSPRLKRVLAYLETKGAGGATTMEIVRACDVCAVNSIIDELRHNGLRIDCLPEGRSATGSNVFRYVYTPSDALAGQGKG